MFSRINGEIVKDYTKVLYKFTNILEIFFYPKFPQSENFKEDKNLNFINVKSEERRGRRRSRGKTKNDNHDG